MNKVQFPEVVDNSMRKAFVRCPKSAHWHYEKGLQPPESRIDLHAGKAFAKGLDAARIAFYKESTSHEEAVERGIYAVLEAYGDRDAGKSNKTKWRMSGALVFYFEQHRMDEDEFRPVVFPDGSVGVEIQGLFEIPVLHPETGKPLKHSFRFDMLAEDRNGDYWGVDEKTTSKLGDSWALQWDLDSQMTCYSKGGKVLLESKGLDPERFKGMVVNGVSILKYDYGHMRVPTPRMDWEIARWHNQMCRDFERWIAMYKGQDHDMVLDHACALYNSPCEYAPLCKSREPHKIENSYEVKFWDPSNPD